MNVLEALGIGVLLALLMIGAIAVVNHVAEKIEHRRHRNAWRR